MIWLLIPGALMVLGVWLIVRGIEGLVESRRRRRSGQRLAPRVVIRLVGADRARFIPPVDIRQRRLS